MISKLFLILPYWDRKRLIELPVDFVIDVLVVEGFSVKVSVATEIFTKDEQ